MVVEQWPLERVKPYPNNPRSISDVAIAKVAASIEAYGFRQPIVVNAAGVILCGHTRALAAKKLGMDVVPVHVARGLTPEQEQAYRIADNRTAAEAEWEWDKLAAELRELPSDLPTGFDPDELERILADALDLPEPDDVPTVDESKPAVSQRGEIYELGPHRLMCGDATRVDDVSTLLRGARVALIFSDPPYGIDYQDVKKQHRRIDGDASLDGVEELLRNLLKFDAPMFLCCNWQCYSTFERAMIAAGRAPKSCIVWDKTSRVQNLDKFGKQHEFILYHGPFGGEPTVDVDVWQCQRQVLAEHPTAKPVELIERAIKHFPAGTVVDLFGGSGSTLIAAAKAGRSARLMELDPRYCDVIRRRWTKFAAENGKPSGSGALDP